MKRDRCAHGLCVIVTGPAGARRQIPDLSNKGYSRFAGPAARFPARGPSTRAGEEAERNRFPMQTRDIDYFDGPTRLSGYLAIGADGTGRRPGVLVFP